MNVNIYLIIIITKFVTLFSPISIDIFIIIFVTFNVHFPQRFSVTKIVSNYANIIVAYMFANSTDQRAAIIATQIAIEIVMKAGTDSNDVSTAAKKHALIDPRTPSIAAPPIAMRNEASSRRFH